MRGKYLIVAVAILVTLTVVNQVKAEDNNPQFGLAMNVSRPLENADFTLKGHLSFVNLLANHTPHGSLGFNYQLNKRFDAELFAGYVFAPDKADQGYFVGFEPTLNWDKLCFSNTFTYYQNWDMLFSFHTLNYQVFKFIRLGIDERNFQYLLPKDKLLIAYQVGPSVKIIFSDRANIKLNYFYSFERDGQDANVFKMTLNLNF
ncbi:MAG: hypothetical protein A2Y82_02680 [Candidatus Buchananbacteria bacterium RBG_13_36_9]|uniref:Uncharacterized protein n=1 Tax=Candidatus Buchananbacteria bacterium RBG_13_36_9 TaxID=1797530 RepID=A0A1G1XNY1_9BACT|nr:MAG: hypothetical protein A2Y82_02680 [Candidatus Buchananbacteria bacterium RBG_13_36_9]